MLDEGLLAEKSGDDVYKMFAKDREGECRPYRSRTCDTLIKRLGVAFCPRDPILNLIPAAFFIESGYQFRAPFKANYNSIPSK